MSRYSVSVQYGDIDGDGFVSEYDVEMTDEQKAALEARLTEARENELEEVNRFDWTIRPAVDPIWTYDEVRRSIENEIEVLVEIVKDPANYV